MRARSKAMIQGETDIDPVCRMAIAAGRSIGALTFRGDSYRFCSLQCAAKFASAPARFVPEEPAR